MHLLKLAMIVAASYRNELYITEDDLRSSMALFDHIEKAMPRVFAGVGKNPINMDKEAVLEAIRFAGGMTMGQLLDKFGHSLRKDEMAEVLETLMIIGRIKFEATSRRYMIVG